MGGGGSRRTDATDQSASRSWLPAHRPRSRELVSLRPAAALDVGSLRRTTRYEPPASATSARPDQTRTHAMSMHDWVDVRSMPSAALATAVAEPSGPNTSVADPKRHCAPV